MLNGSIEKLNPKYEFLVRWICKVVGATLRTWPAKPRKKKEGKIVLERLREGSNG